jgi:hypothetical protein
MERECSMQEFHNESLEILSWASHLEYLEIKVRIILKWIRKHSNARVCRT